MKTPKQIKGTNYEETVAKILANPNLTWKKKHIAFDVECDDERIQGKSSLKHQIDIHLKSSKNDNYHLICECKCHNKKVDKQKASAFFGIYNDIKKKHKDWNIVAVYASDEGFTRDAKKMLIANNIGIIHLKDVSRRKIKLSISESSTRPSIKITKVIMEDGSIAKPLDLIKNDGRGGFFRPENIIGSYEWLDERNQIINDRVYYIGFFKTGKQQIKYSDFDKFVRASDGLEILEIQGIVGETIHEEHGTSSTIFDSDVDGILNLIDSEYVFYKNGKIEKRRPPKK